ncbi:unnamed protein product [Cuscuta epithymum]|uniref:Ubiquitin-like protease family profile domain-containing protein n=1 Tax=Cuscuta epithymum TaxID=186058 RepID=A0AAV0GEV8_9ASTE|nr:unnamed protein product [Cuscuta epithymum]
MKPILSPRQFAHPRHLPVELLQRRPSHFIPPPPSPLKFTDTSTLPSGVCKKSRSPEVIPPPLHSLSEMVRTSLTELAQSGDCGIMVLSFAQHLMLDIPFIPGCEYANMPKKRREFANGLWKVKDDKA